MMEFGALTCASEPGPVLSSRQGTETDSVMLRAARSTLAAGSRVREDGSVQLTTTLHMRRQRALGKLHCTACGIFCIGERGRRTPTLTPASALTLTSTLTLERYPTRTLP